MRAGGEVDPRMAARLLGNGAPGGAVVGVHTDEKVVIPVLDGRQIVFQHAADDRLLVPQRHKDGDGPLRRAAHVGIRGPREADPAGREPDQGDKQVIQPANHNPYRNRYQERGNPVIQAVK